MGIDGLFTNVNYQNITGSIVWFKISIEVEMIVQHFSDNNNNNLFTQPLHNLFLYIQRMRCFNTVSGSVSKAQCLSTVVGRLFFAR